MIVRYIPQGLIFVNLGFLLLTISTLSIEKDELSTCQDIAKTDKVRHMSTHISNDNSSIPTMNDIHSIHKKEYRQEQPNYAIDTTPYHHYQGRQHDNIEKHENKRTSNRDDTYQ